MKIKEQIGSSYALLSGMLYGLLGFFGQSLIVFGFSISAMTFWRFFSAAVFMALLMLLKGASFRVRREDFFTTIFAGTLFYAVPAMLFFVAARYIGTGQAMVIFFTFPAFVMFYNCFFLGEKLQARSVLALIIIIAGMVCLVDVGELGFDLQGVGLSVITALFYAVYVIMSKSRPIEPMMSTLLVSVGGGLSALTISLFEGSLRCPEWGLELAYSIGIGIFCTAIPILLMLKALTMISSEKASILSILEPLFTVLFGVFLLGEILAYNHIVGIALILVGALSIMIKPGKKALDKA